MRKTQFATGEYYHVYNRGTDKRDIVVDTHDSHRFVRSMIAFNLEDPIGSLHQQSFNTSSLSTPGTKSQKPLVEIVAYCLNPNHYHILLSPLVEHGVSDFIQKLGGGFTRYFNERYERSGVLFQGAFKARHITNNHDLLRMSAYVNLNDKVHQLSTRSTKLVRSSWAEYAHGAKGICEKDIVLGQFNSRKAYTTFATKTVKEIVHERAQADAAEGKIKKEFYARHFD